MLYDNGGMGGRPLPMPKPLKPPTALKPNYQNQALFNLGRLNKRLPAYRQLLQAQGPNHQNPMELSGPNRQLVVGQPQTAMYPQPRPQYQFAGGMAGGGVPSMGYQPQHQMYQRDVNGKPPGAWGYQQPQYYGNPFLPMMLK